MATNKRPVLIRVQPVNYDKFKVIADKNGRSVSNQLEYLMRIFIENYEAQNGQIPLVDENTGANSAVINEQVGNNNNFVNRVSAM